MKNVHAEIQYRVETEGGSNIHSDICPSECKLSNMTPEHRKFLHVCLDEWLDKSNGTGAFYIAEEGFLNNEFTDSDSAFVSKE